MNTNAIERRQPQEITAEAPGRDGWTYCADVDVIDTPEEVRIFADVPGAARESIDVTFEDGVVTIRAHDARPRPENLALARHEFGVGDYHRRFAVGAGIDEQKISADYDAGVVTVHLPKAAASRCRRIEVRAG